MCSCYKLRYTVSEHEPQRPWVMVNRTRGLVGDLNGEDFLARPPAPGRPRYKTKRQADELRPSPKQ
jgi:hypothetical protein